jgi:hypothetical protein
MTLIRSSLQRFWVTVGLLLRCTWWLTLRIEIVCEDAASDPRRLPRRRILSLWHEDIICSCVSFANCNLKVLVSHSKDGDYISRTIEALGFTTIRGSSKRGGAQALREMIGALENHCIAITPDGPKGPRQEVKHGVTYLASRTGVPIVALGVAYSRAHRFGSWDRMAFPWPWSRTVIYLLSPLEVPRSADKEDLDAFTSRLQQRMQAAQLRAIELLAEWQRTGRPPRSEEATESARNLAA